MGGVGDPGARQCLPLISTLQGSNKTWPQPGENLLEGWGVQGQYYPHSFRANISPGTPTLGFPVPLKPT